MILKIPRNEIGKIDIINVKGGITATQVYNKYKPDYMINLALYDTNTKTNITNLVDEGVTSGYLFSDEGIGIKGDNEIVFCTKTDKTIRDFVAGSPILIKNSAKNIDWGNKYSEYVDKVHYRSAVGFNSKELILYTSNFEISLDTLTKNLIDVCDYAINCDGGGSCHLQHWDKVYQKWMDVFRNWLNVSKDAVLKALNEKIFLEDWEKYAKGNISSWEMEALCFYYHEHELANVNRGKYGLSNFFELPEDPIVAKVFYKGDKEIKMFKLHKICGTCIAKDKTMSRKQTGRVGLSMAINYFTIKGYTVSLPMNDT